MHLSSPCVPHDLPIPFSSDLIGEECKTPSFFFMNCLMLFLVEVTIIQAVLMLSFLYGSILRSFVYVIEV